MIFIFLIMVLLGVIQIILKYQKRKDIRLLSHITTVPATNRLAHQLQQNTLWQYVTTVFGDIQNYLLGREYGLVLKHGIVIVIVQGVSVYISQQYLHVTLHVSSPLVLVLTLYVLFYRNKKAIRKSFETAFSESLNIINSTIGAGNSLMQGIEQCGEKIEGILGDEFRKISQRLEIGEDIETVLMDSYRLFPYREYYFFIVTVLINMKGGGQVREIMTRLSTMISNGRIVERKKIAMTSEVRMSVKILTAIPVLFFFFIKYNSPENFDILMYDPIGQVILCYAIGSISLGVFILWLMMNKL